MNKLSNVLLLGTIIGTVNYSFCSMENENKQPDEQPLMTIFPFNASITQDLTQLSSNNQEILELLSEKDPTAASLCHENGEIIAALMIKAQPNHNKHELKALARLHEVKELFNRNNRGLRLNKIEQELNKKLETTWMIPCQIGMDNSQYITRQLTPQELKPRVAAYVSCRAKIKQELMLMLKDKSISDEDVAKVILFLENAETQILKAREELNNSY